MIKFADSRKTPAVFEPSLLPSVETEEYRDWCHKLAVIRKCDHCGMTFTTASLLVAPCPHRAQTGRYSHIDYQTEDFSDWDKLSMGEDVYMCLLSQSKLHSPTTRGPAKNSHRAEDGSVSVILNRLSTHHM